MKSVIFYLKQSLYNAFRALYSKSFRGKRQKLLKHSFSDEAHKCSPTTLGNTYGSLMAECEHPLSRKTKLDAWYQILAEVHQNPQKYYK